MDVMTFVNRYGMFFYIVTLILAIVFNMTGLELINITVSIVLNILYFIVLVGAILSFRKSKDKNNQTLLFIFLPIFLLCTGINFKVISTMGTIFPVFIIGLFAGINLKLTGTMVVAFPVFFFEGINKVRRIIGILIYLIFIFLGMLGFLIAHFGSNTIIAQQYSPNGVYRTVTIDSDQGALGGDTYVDLEEIYYGIFKRNVKTLYHGHWGEKPETKWVDNSTVKIDGKAMNIHTSSTWENKL